MHEDWDVRVSFLPGNWRALADETGALKGRRKDKAVENLLRTLLLHLGCGHSLRETGVRARQAHLADLSAVAVLKRLRKLKDWLPALCVAWCREQGIAVAPPGRFPVRAFAAPPVKEPGKTGALWRVHYSVRLPSLPCDFFALTAPPGPRAGASLPRFPVQAGAPMLADRGDSTADGIGHVAAAGGRIIVRVTPGALAFRTPTEEPFARLAAVTTLNRAGAVQSWRVKTVGADGAPVPGRVCGLRKTRTAIGRAHRRLHRKASKPGQHLKPAPLRFAESVLVFTTFPESFAAEEMLEWYRTRWQGERVFKRCKSLAQLGHLPTHNDDSAQAGLYGKLLMALLGEKRSRHATRLSPWGYDVAPPPTAQRVAGLPVRAPPTHPRHCARPALSPDAPRVARYLPRVS